METSKACQIWKKCLKHKWKEIEYRVVKESLIVPEQLINIEGEKNVEDGADLKFVCFVAIRPKSTAMVKAGRSDHLTTIFPRHA